MYKFFPFSLLHITNYVPVLSILKLDHLQLEHLLHANHYIEELIDFNAQFLYINGVKLMLLSSMAN